MKTKKCGKCGEFKCVSEFYKNKSTKDGLGDYCKLCVKENQRLYYINNCEKVKDSHKQYYINNCEKVKDSHKQWRTNNRKDANEYQKRWAIVNSEKIKEINQKYYINNSEKIKEKRDYLTIPSIAHNNNLTTNQLKNNPILYESLKTLVLIKRELRKCK
jgi:hypothetical protein